MTRSWFIDAWAVRDGVAFASLRSEHAIDAVNTVFLSVPSLEPIPVGRISTALRATRGSFQAGFHNFENHEIPFDDLIQVRELIRRGYLASGIGPGGVAAPPGLEPPPEPGGPGGAHYEDAIYGMELAGRNWLGADDDPAASLTQVVPGELAQVAPMVRAFAEATVVEWERALQGWSVEGGPEEQHDLYPAMRGLHHWYWALLSRGVWHDLDELESFASRHDLPLGRQLSGRARGRWLILGEGRRDRSEQELLTMAPCPLHRDWNRRLRRLSDKLFLAMTDSEYFGYNRGYAELAPIALMAMLSVPDDRYEAVGVEPEVAFQDRLRDALEWLAGELPVVQLPSAADELLNQYARTMLEASEER